MNGEASGFGHGRTTRVTEHLVDIGGHDLGIPASVVRVRSKDDLRAALATARATGRRFAAMGLRATYWHNLSLDGAVVADLTGFDRVLATEETDGYVTVESGIPVRKLDEHLRAHGGHLAMHPDAYGDTPVAAAFANGTTAGIGMLWGSFGDRVLGLEVMLGDGTLLQIGASRVVGVRRRGIASGIPDLRSLFFGAEGALGIVTEMDVALIPVPWEARLSWIGEGDRFSDVLGAGLHWRRRGCIETMRWTWMGTGELAVTVTSRVSRSELDARVAQVCESFHAWAPPRVEVATDAERRGVRPDYDRKWPGPPGSTWAYASATPFAGIDAFVPYSRASDAYSWARAINLPVPHRKRVAAYVGRDGINIGVHCMFDDEPARARGRTELEARLAELAAFDAVPYRPGVVWMRTLRWDPRTLEAVDAVATALDPDRRIRGTGLLSGRTPGDKDRA